MRLVKVRISDEEFTLREAKAAKIGRQRLADLRAKKKDSGGFFTKKELTVAKDADILKDFNELKSICLNISKMFNSADSLIIDIKKVSKTKELANAESSFQDAWEKLAHFRNMINKIDIK